MMNLISARLRRLADHARACGDDDFAEGFELYLAKAPAGLSLDRALGLTVERGGERWWSVEHRQRRDEAIREFFVRYCPGATDARRRATLQHELRRYERKYWKIDKRLMPSTGTPRALLALAFHEHESLDAHRPFPTSDNQMPRILANHCAADRKSLHEISTVDGEGRSRPNDSTKGETHHAGIEISITSQRRRGRGRS